ncbi:GMC oxidoreductase [Microdochium trichocladiopsis]|uniref:GMC oxidoreductase n=1 Tax=Microdochium trichocladiopsis TaxID=1682393 RepID=A0A9P8XUV9_9PEZI|nr:GMC oxidoreductase [Microdochium trichocladiopsis]KAH7014188.1 GMC oxidoreductase [Microdochium trichocladiopsis]
MRSWNLALLPIVAGRWLKPQSTSADSYDYIIVGGGTSGLVVAKRLSEDPATSVLVIEAGGSVKDNVNVTNPLGYSLAFGTEIDWQFETIEQKFTGGSKQTLRAGKALGGTSTINGMAFTRAESTQIDAWEILGNEGWNWENLLPYYLKSEHFQVPADSRAAAGHLTFAPEFHGLEGPLKTGWMYPMTNGTVNSMVNDTMKAMDVAWNADVNSGVMAGFTIFPATIDQDLNIREDAARAYYYPFQESQSNLHVLLNTHATRVIWAKSASLPTAEGVEIISANGTKSLVKAKKEVILSAGALVSPLLLELSGVGNPEVLAKHGIETVVNLPTVGENLQDQMNNALQYNIANSYDATEKNTMVVYPTAAEIFGEDTAEIAAKLKAALPAYAVQVASASGNATSADDLLQFFQLQYDLIFNSDGKPTQIPLAEVLLYQQNGIWDSEYWGLLPFARGSVHVGSANSTANAVINPNYFMLDWDLTEQAGGAAFIRRMFNTAPLADVVGSEILPGLDAVPQDASLEQWGSYLKGNYRSNFHPVGTAAMMPKEKGGVVDVEMKVYGTANLRVMDASVLPFQVCGHLTSTLYAVAERLSDIIKRGSA